MLASNCNQNDINYPFAKSFTDFRDIDLEVETLQEKEGNKKIRGLQIEEMHFDGESSKYIGIFYVGHLPTEKECLELIKKAGLTIDEEDIQGKKYR